MAWPVAVAGTVHVDNITTPRGSRRELLGGSTVYFSLAASARTEVHLNGIVGSDIEPQLRATLAGLPVVLDGLVVHPGRTFRWTAVHDFDRWVTASEEEELGVDEEWDGRLPAAAAAAPVLFVGSMRPRFQLEVLRQSRARLVGADTMTIFIGAEAALLEQVIEAADILFINRAELAALAGAPLEGWEDSARGLLGRGRLRAAVVKGGPKGAAVVTRERTVERAAAPVAAVLDPTGAGDALAGGMLGACAAAERDDAEFLAGPALDEGLRQAARAISAFGTDGLRGVLRRA